MSTLALLRDLRAHRAVLHDSLEQGSAPDVVSRVRRCVTEAARAIWDACGVRVGTHSPFFGIDRSVAPPRHGKLRTHIVPTPRGQHQVTYYDEAQTIDPERLREVLKGVMMKEPQRPIEWVSPAEYERRALQHWDLAKEPLRFLGRWAAARRRVGGDDEFDRTITPIPQELLDYAQRRREQVDGLAGRLRLAVDLGYKPSTGQALMIWTDEPKDTPP